MKYLKFLALLIGSLGLILAGNMLAHPQTPTWVFVLNLVALQGSSMLLLRWGFR